MTIQTKEEPEMNNRNPFEDRPVTKNPQKNLLEIEEHMYILDDVEKPNVFRNMFPYSEVPIQHFVTDSSHAHRIPRSRL